MRPPPALIRSLALLGAMCGPLSASAETFYEVDGVVSMEAEHFTSNNGYTVRSDNGPGGQASGWSGDGWIYSDSSAAQRLNYSITFTQTGTYWVHLRALAGFNADWSSNVEGLDNGYHAELDGTRISGPGIYVSKEQRWAWYGSFQDEVHNGVGVSFTVGTPGTHVFSIVRREDLSRLDKIVLHDGTYGTSESSSLSGSGPAETLDPGSATDAGTVQQDAGGSTGQTVRIEAEHMSLSTYRVEGGAAFASNNAMISFLDGATGESGTATASFSGAAAHYDVVVAYFDENDGVSQVQVSIGGAQVDSFSMDQDLGDNRASAQTLVRRTVARAHTLSPGTTIRINGTEGGLEHARIDYVELIPVASQPDASLPDLLLPDLRQPDLGRPDAATSDLLRDDLGSQADQGAPPDLAGADLASVDRATTDLGATPLEDSDGGSNELVAEGGCGCAGPGRASSAAALLFLLGALCVERRRSVGR